MHRDDGSVAPSRIRQLTTGIDCPVLGADAPAQRARRGHCPVVAGIARKPRALGRRICEPGSGQDISRSLLGQASADRRECGAPERACLPDSVGARAVREISGRADVGPRTASPVGVRRAGTRNSTACARDSKRRAADAGRGCDCRRSRLVTWRMLRRKRPISPSSEKLTGDTSDRDQHGSPFQPVAPWCIPGLCSPSNPRSRCTGRHADRIRPLRPAAQLPPHRAPKGTPTHRRQ